MYLKCLLFHRQRKAGVGVKGGRREKPAPFSRKLTQRTEESAYRQNGIFGVLSGFSHLFDDGAAVGEMKAYAVEGEVESLEIDLGGARLEI